MHHPGIDTIGASLQLEFGFIKVTSIRSLERTVRLCRRQHIDGRRLHGDALCPQAALCTLCTVVVQARNTAKPRKSIDDWLIERKTSFWPLNIADSLLRPTL